MPSAVLTKDLKERQLPVVGLAAMLAVFALVGLAIGAGLQDTIGDLTRGFPDALTAFIGGDAPGGYVVAEVFNLIAPLALVGYAVMTGASAVAGEEEAGTMDLLAAHPITRREILAAKAVGLVTALAATVMVFGLAAALSAAAFDTGLTVSAALATCVHLFVLAVMFGALALAVGAATGNPGTAAAVAGVVALLSYVTDAMLPLAGLHGWARLSPWYYYAGSQPLANGLDPWHLLVLVVLTIAALAAAFVSFDRRDLKG